MIKVYEEMLQGSDEWLAARCGLLTASEMKHIITPAKLAYSNSEKERSHLYELAAQRITSYVEPGYISDDMLRGMEDEVLARELYATNYAPVTQVGFVTNDCWGFTLGCSPDGLVGENGCIETKSRRQKYQVETIANYEMPVDYVLQVQSILLITERKWCDFNSYCGGLPMVTIRVYPDAVVQEAIVAAAGTFHAKLDNLLKVYEDRLRCPENRMLKTERRKPLEMKEGVYE
jgi:YqaJ-like viral recombinase domain